MPETQYARSGDVHIAYQVFGSGPLDLVVTPGAFSHVELVWDSPPWVRLYERLASFARVAVFDKRVTGLSDRNVGIASLEERIDDARAVMDACGMDQVSMFGWSEGGPMQLLFAATFPERVRSMVMYASSPLWKEVPDVPGSDRAAAFAEGFLAAVETDWGGGSGVEYFIGEELATPEARLLGGRFRRNMASPTDAAQIVKMLAEIAVREVLPLVTCPTLVMAATEDVIGPPETNRWMAEQLPNAVYKEVPGPHNFSSAHSDLEYFADLIEEFLTGTTPAAPVDRALATVLFTDIVNSTAAAAGMGDQAWRELLDSHDRHVETQAQRCRGDVIKSTGDGVLATFDGPGRAVDCALALTDELRELGLEIRAGVHTGEIELRGDDVSGMAVNLASRVESLAQPGQVLVSRTVTDLVVGSHHHFEPAGSHELKGIPGTWDLYAATIP